MREIRNALGGVDAVARLTGVTVHLPPPSLSPRFPPRPRTVWRLRVRSATRSRRPPPKRGRRASGRRQTVRQFSTRCHHRNYHIPCLCRHNPSPLHHRAPSRCARLSNVWASLYPCCSPTRSPSPPARQPSCLPAVLAHLSTRPVLALSAGRLLPCVLSPPYISPTPFCLCLSFSLSLSPPQQWNDALDAELRAAIVGPDASTAAAATRPGTVCLRVGLRGDLPLLPLLVFSSVRQEKHT